MPVCARILSYPSRCLVSRQASREQTPVFSIPGGHRPAICTLCEHAAQAMLLTHLHMHGQVAYLEAVDAMVGQLVRRLAEAEAASSLGPHAATELQAAATPAAAQPGHSASASPSGSRAAAGSAAAGQAAPGQGSPANKRQAQCWQFALCVTGDHSTPVVFGDHSHEPVPFALAHAR